MLQKEIRAELKKAGAKFGEQRTSSRVRYWPTGGSEGWDMGEVYPWYSTYVRKGYRLKSYLNERTQDISLSYRAAWSSSKTQDGADFQSRKNEQDEIVRSTLTRLGVKFTEKDGEFKMEVENPYSEAEVKRAEEKWNRITRG